MRTWTRATMRRLCGRCGLPIAPGEPCMRITVAGVAHDLLRCQVCEVATEGTPAPADLPPVSLQAAPPIDLTRAGLLPLDFSRREPGMEGR